MRSLESSSNQPLASPSIDEKLSAVDLKSKKKKMSDDASAAAPAAAAVAATKSESEYVEAHSPQDEDVLGEMRDVRLRDRQRSNTLGGYRLGKKESSSSWSSSTAFGRLSSAFNVKTSSSKKDQQSQPQLQLHHHHHQQQQLHQQQYQQQAAELSKEEKAALKAAEKEQRQRAKAEKKNKDRSRKSKSPGAALSDGETTPTSFFSKERIVGGRFGSGFRSPPPRTDYTVSLPPLGTAASTANQHRSIFSINWNQGPSSTLPPRSPNRSSGPQSATSYITRGLGRFQLKRRNTSTLPPQQETERKLSQPPVPANFQNYGSLLRRHSVDPDRRRSVNRDRSLDDSLHHTALIHRAHSHGESAAYRCASGLASSESSICDRIDIEDLGVDETLLFVKFFRYYYCYDLIPLSAKLVVFDSQLLVKKAFFALVSNGVRAAPLWDSAQQSFVGMLTITDFIHILRKYYKSPMVRMDELEEHKIDTWRTVLTDMQRPLVSIGPDASLCDAITTLIHSKVHRLPVIDPQTGNVLYVLTHKRILRFLFLYFYDLPHASYLDKSIRELKVGTFDNIATCSPGTPLITALNMFIERRVSALPVVDEDNKVVDIYAKFDVINLASEKTYNNLDMSVGKALEFRNQDFEGVMTCQANDSLLQVMEKIVKAEVHRLVIVDEDDHVDGIVSLSDILTFLVLTPLGIERPASRAYYTRTTSSDRENGTVEEEPELEAKANVHGEQVVETERERQRHDSLDSQKTLSEGSRGKLGSRNNSEVGVPEEDEEENVQQEQQQPPPTTTADDSPQSEETTEASKSSDA